MNDYQPGDKLPNGATFIHATPIEGNRWIVFAQYGKDWVSWHTNGINCFGGHYLYDFVSAVNRYQQRIKDYQH